MVRVLHLTSAQPDFQSRRSAAALARDAGGEFHVVTRTVGPGGHYRNLPHAMFALRRDVGYFHLLHAFDLPAMTAAALAGGRIVFTPSRFLAPRDLRWLRRVMAYRDVQVCCPTATLRGACAGRGLPPERCHVIRPGVDFALIGRRHRDDNLRSRLGLGPEDRVLLLPGESTRAAAHADAVWAGSICHIIDARYKVLLWGAGGRAGAAAARARELAQPDLVRVARERLGPAAEFEDLLPAADAVLVTARGPVATLPIATCMAAALPIVSTSTHTMAEVLTNDATALISPAPAPPAVARRVLDLYDDPQRQLSLGDAAYAEAAERFTLSSFLDHYRNIYRRVAAGEPVAPPEATAQAVSGASSTD